MLTRLGAAARRHDMTVEAFQAHWRTQHGDTAGAIPNLRRYVQHHAVLEGGRPLLPYPGFDACSELDFDSLESMDEGFRLAAEDGELKADEDRFVDKTRFSYVHGEIDVRTPTGAVDDPVTSVTWWRAHTAADPDRLHSVLTGAWERALDPSWFAGRRLLAARPDWHEGRDVPSADVVEFIVFDGIDAARRFHAEHAPDLGPILAGVAFGAERHVARPVVIVGGDAPF
jgi:uncharacterized protein (TIGR02118 family)